MAKQYLARLTFEEELRRQQQYTEPECRCPVCGSVAENPVVFALNGKYPPNLSRRKINRAEHRGAQLKAAINQIWNLFL